MNDQDGENRADRALIARLAKLRSMPVDTAGFDARLRGTLNQASPARGADRGRLGFIGRARSWAAAAALLVVASVAAVLLVASSGQALAAPAEMAAMHQKLISGQLPVTRVSSVAEAEQVVKSQWEHAPAMPAMPADHLAACCLKSVRNRPVACLLFEGTDAPISVMVAKADDFKLPDGARRSVNGVECRVTAAGEINIVLVEHDGRLVCVMGAVAVDRLIDLAGQMRF